MLRQRPADLFFREAQAHHVGILARVPLASGLLTGKFSAESTFSPNDHRNYNRHGAAFDVGETFSGVPYDVGLQAVSDIEALKPDGMTMAQFALRWILEFDAVTCAIPGAKRPSQVVDNAAASDLEPLSAETMAAVKTIYDEQIYQYVHQRW